MLCIFGCSLKTKILEFAQARATALRTSRSKGKIDPKEERRPHVHVSCADGEAKFWLDPTVELVKNYGLSKVQIGEMQKIVEERKDELIRAWQSHFST